jgi:twitching motility protein PilT
VLNFDLPGFLAAALAAEPSAADVLFAVGCPPQVLVNGELKRRAVGGLERLSPFQTEAIVLHLLAMAPPSAGERLRQQGAASFAYSVPGVARFRAIVFTQRGTFAVALRAISEHAPALDTLGLPPAVRAACSCPNGLILVNGPAGSGRSTTLAAMIQQINRTRACHVVTVEEPIEFLHRHDCATVNQREVGTDTPSLAHGLRDALQVGAQVLVAGEVRSGEEARLLVEAADTGLLVLSSLRGGDTASALARLLALWPHDERADAARLLARVLRWSFTQHLLPHHEGRQAVVEVWRATPATTGMLAEGAPASKVLAQLLCEGEAEGQAALDRELERRVRAGRLDPATALARAVLPDELQQRLLHAGGKR